MKSSVSIICLLLIFVSSGLRAQNALSFAPLMRADGSIFEQVRAAAAKRKLKGVEIFEKQSFRLMQDGKPAAVLVTGRVTAPSDPDSFACFVTMVEANTVPKILLTIGDGMYLLQRCGVVKSLGLVDTNTASPSVRIGMLFDDSHPVPETRGQFLDQVDAIVFSWNGTTHQLSIDEKSTDRVNQAGVENLPALLRALR